ncbi:dTDP-4-dehydrorhamnose 3,5-epimerase family protein [Amphritea sp. HPY]|uniref:dTDP-4-dehydrorhamnose 3,5-epimerase family protein n=1 Tax=Amphritea sp. HPY TaxID=3421652 RepID=UPI003D7CB80B
MNRYENQIKQRQGKLVRVTSGEVLDVAVDLRENSPTFGQWLGEYLSEDNKRMLWIPPGFAHGFLVTSEVADFQYKCTDVYAPEHEGVIYWADETLDIKCLFNRDIKPVISEKDRKGLSLHNAEFY